MLLVVRLFDLINILKGYGLLMVLLIGMWLISVVIVIDFISVELVGMV